MPSTGWPASKTFTTIPVPTGSEKPPGIATDRPTRPFAASSLTTDNTAESGADGSNDAETNASKFES